MPVVQAQVPAADPPLTPVHGRPGPRDGLMTGAHARFGWKIWKVRTGVEVTVLAIGWLLGGTVGFGTVAFALLIGPMVGVTLPLLRVPEPATARAEEVTA